MHIVVEPSDFVPLNAGDMAMQHVALTRLAALWPAASIRVLSDVPDRLPRYAPNVVPLDARGRHAWIGEGADTPVSSRLTFALMSRLARWEDARARRVPWRLERALRLPPDWRRYADPEIRRFVDTVSSAAVVAVSGMGGITDAFPEYAIGLLKTLGLAIHRRVPIVLVGQGIGPLHDPLLRARAREVLPRADLIALREDRAGRPLLRSLGVPDERVWTTGDDAIEIPYARRGDTPGTGLGVNLRASSYADVDDAMVEHVERAVRATVARLGMPVVPIPISRVPGEEDARTIRRLVPGCDPDDGTAPGEPLDHVIDAIKRCRVVVCGSYHAGVFALSLGIPAVCLARSPYYVDKFLGLADQFGRGCEVVRLDEPGTTEAIDAAIERSWEAAVDLRPGLLAAAARQIDLSRAAYRKIYDLVERRPR